ncbi:DUF1481 domain-containing protein [Erwinia rhapontici]|uniref:DUF1481 domain-containing protein n=1 Tax=Erwinia rhapontici TaxID=55212 RepID=UPI0035B571FC|nr:lipase chaperone LimK [Erwinia rhapontici]
MLILLAGCSSHSDLPDFTASGYLADRGTVRIWRKNQHEQVSHLMTVHTPFNGAATETSDYLWQQGKLVSVERHVIGDKPDDVTLRFDQDGSLSFMQRQLSGRREALSADEIALYQFDAQRMLKISDDLLSGNVLLRQGSWQQDGTITTCQGKTVRPELDQTELGRIARQQRDTSGPVSIAWLEAPAGTQLLLVSASDFCKTEPKEEGF